jgi:S-adenosylmethionine decarboxylase proenzyme
VSFIKQSMLKAAEISGATILNSIFQESPTYGVLGIVIVSESHLSIHTWPEYRYAAVDIFTCGQKANPWKASEYLESSLEAKSVKITDFVRGTILESLEVQSGHQ